MRYSDALAELATTGAQDFVPYVIGAVLLVLVGGIILFFVQRRQRRAERANEAAIDPQGRSGSGDDSTVG
ncbi:LPXTG cell wall anchor domain-containing protein [Pseudoclavibacter sp. VKM Ac-2867]|uniref:LPXTG cell wall anchor domain-containing protein n=1 Tax=Pseudoclavibacter sp. VKM Ac-2867 TaxID=2783829 RepID=UPI00188BFB21|nr:LPXTG cell wall anchor domain-containing protein [Pseudoclavibacter sp. VKM Ac-2867]MBF4460610.1 LPXTG cell wall anchor domain-containing protein [Pseudoclavibacter sp. VKM Ac-2867]